MIEKTESVWRQAMERAGYTTMKSLADAIGVSHKTISCWIRGDYMPSSNADAEAVADALYTDVQELFPNWAPRNHRPQKEQSGAKTPMHEAIARAGYESVTQFAEVLGTCARVVGRWAINPPRDDCEVYRIAGLLHVAPTDLWPGWEPNPTKFAEIMRAAGYENSTALAVEIGMSAVAVDAWMYKGVMPSRDADVLRVAELLHVEPNVLWPDWKPRPWQSKEPRLGVNTASRKTKYGAHNMFYEPDGGYDGMADLRRNAKVYAGQRMLVAQPRAGDGIVRRTGTVVQCADRWFRVRYDAGWCECFHYQARFDRTEHKYFRAIKRDGGGV